MNANVHESVGIAVASGVALLVPAMNGYDRTTLCLGLGCAMIGALLFLIVCIVGYNTPHRTFTHWLIGLVCFTIPFILMTNITLGLWFGVGMLSHQVIDMLNKKKITWLFPLPIDFARYICHSSSHLSSAIGAISTVLACIFIILLAK